MRDNVLCGSVSRPDLAPWTIGFYHEPVRGDGSDREKIFLRFQRTEMQKDIIVDSIFFFFFFIELSQESRTIDRTIH